jgi:cobyrinic acid a,c-diamide synthase
MVSFSLPRVVVAGLAGSAGKTLVSTGLIRAFRRRGLRVAPFKKGPDYIDPAWLCRAAGYEARSLDTFLMSEGAIIDSLEGASGADIAVIEGNRGLFDGLDAKGTHSTAELAKRIHAPLVLVIDVSKSTRTIAALVLGCLALDPALPLAGVILNRVGSSRHERIIREAIALVTSVPVLGAIPKLSFDHLPSRHLGLVMPDEREDRELALNAIGDAIDSSVDVEAIHCLAEQAPRIPSQVVVRSQILLTGRQPRVGGGELCLPELVAGGFGDPSRVPITTIGILRDKAFAFYYPENLAALEAQGAKLVPISPLRDTELPKIDALYAGGGYPEEHAAGLAANAQFRAALAARIAEGLPVWAECGGLMYLATALVCKGERYPMVGALPIEIEQTGHHQAHGYVEACVDTENPFLPCGTQLRGHEFHFSRLVSDSAPIKTALALGSGVGIGNGRDGIVVGRVFASYLHLFAPGAPTWAPAFVRVARKAQEALTQPTIGDTCGIHYSTRRADRSRRGRVHSGAF